MVNERVPQPVPESTGAGDRLPMNGGSMSTMGDGIVGVAAGVLFDGTVITEHTAAREIRLPDPVRRQLGDGLSAVLLWCAILAAAGVPAAALHEGGIPAERPVEEIRILKAGGGRLDWSVQGDWIAFDRLAAADLYEIFLMKPDGSGEHCLTCDLSELRQANKLAPSWHPSGSYLVFQLQRRPRRLELGVMDLLTPERGLRSELCVVERRGGDYWQITRVAERGGAVVEPHFSHEGRELLWSERIRSQGGRWGEWTLRVAEFRIRAGVPRLGRVRSFQPGEQRGLLLASGFSPNDREVLLAGNLEAGQAESGLDIYLLELPGGKLTRLSDTRRAWDEHAVPSPRGDLLVWVSDSDLPLPAGGGPWGPGSIPVRELWMMSPDGSQKRRLTFFNHPSAPEFLRRASVGDFAWSPEGDRIAVHVVFERAGPREAIYLIRLDESFRR